MTHLPSLSHFTKRERALGEPGPADWHGRLTELGLEPGLFQPKSPLDLYPALLSLGQVHALQLALLRSFQQFFKNLYALLKKTLRMNACDGFVNGDVAERTSQGGVSPHPSFISLSDRQPPGRPQGAHLLAFLTRITPSLAV